MLPPLSPDQQVKPRHFELRIAILFTCIFIPNGIHLPYFPLWLELQQFTPSEIAVILSAPFFVRIFAGPIVSAYADRAPDRVPVLVTCAALSAIACAGYFLPATYVVVLAVSVLLAVVWAPHTPLSDSIALSGVRRYGVDYAGMRIWGSISFLVTNVVGGYVLAVTGAGIVPWLMLGGLSSVVVAAWFLPRLGRPRVAAPNPADTLPQAAFALRQPYFLLIIAASGLAQSSHAFAYAFTSIYWKSIGIGDGWIGLLWAFSVFAEVLMFVVFRRFFGNVRPGVILAIGTGIGAVRWIIYPLVWPAGLGLGGFFAVQALHAFSFSLAFLGTQKMFTETVPEERMGAAQGAAFFLNMGMLAVFTLISGPLYEAFGASGFFAMALVAAAGTASALWALAYPQRSGSGG
jgi:PPP family 3-phenylpropionic acid transporter